MNSAVYVFGSLRNGFTQYPEDYTKDIFDNFHYSPLPNSQIVIHRENNLMYYGYIRKLDEDGRFIGLCILLNGIAFTQIKKLFSIFENAIANLIAKGIIIQFNDVGNLTSNIKSLSEKNEEVERIISYIRNEIVTLENNAVELPPVNYGISINEKKFFSLNNNITDIIESSQKPGYTFIQKNTNYDIESISNFKGILKRLNTEKENLENECGRLKAENFKLRNKQRNTKWVGCLIVVVAILSVILYFKVINPNEVTNYKTKEFIYYGNIKNGRPHGIGVAIYPSNDIYKRKYYFGNFINGTKKDTAAILLYQGGDHFYGEINDDHFVKGKFYRNTDNSFYEGTFKITNQPLNGAWYDYKKVYNVIEGN